MIALAVLPVFAVLVAAPTGPEDGCPSARQVTDAMQARFPEFLVQASQTSGSAMSDILHAVLDVAPDGTVVRFSLVDSRGEIQLRRALPASGRGTSPADCVALADTVAAIVERFLAAIAYEGTETDPWNARGQLRKPPDATGVDATHRGLTGSGRFLAVLGGGWRLTAGGEAGQGQVGQSGPEARLGVQSHLTRSLPRLAAVASVGIGRAIEFDLPDGSPRATLRRFPIRIGGLWTMPAGPGWLEPALQTGVDLMLLSSTRRVDTPASSMVRFNPVVEAIVGYRFHLIGTIFVRPSLTIGLCVTRYDVAVDQASGTAAPQVVSVLTTPRAYLSLGLETALVFR